MWEKIKKMISPEPPEVFILARSGPFGLETYINPKVLKLSEPYKKQLISFLNGYIETLEGEGSKKK